MFKHSFAQNTGYVSLFTLALSCSSYSATIVKVQDNDAGIGGGSSTGGSNSTASTNNTGTSMTGGTTSSGPNSTVDTNVMGGALSTGGTVTLGSVSAAGGSAATGGVSAAGGSAATGGVSAAGGSATTGGTPYTGSSAYCTINSVIYADGARNPNDKCQSCQLAVSNSLWVALPEGGSCDSTKVCHLGSCQPGCRIDSQYYPEGASKPNVPCMTCQSAVSTSAWTQNKTNCGCTGAFEMVDSSTGLCVAMMANIPATKTNEGFSIDMTEVTQGQYDGWLATYPKLPVSTDDDCGWKMTYAEQGVGFIGTDAAHHPVVYVDWCDAYAYCAGAGKRLCGAIVGGPNVSENSADAIKNQWYYACTVGETYRYSYGGTYQPSYCNGGDFSTTPGTVVVGSLPNCVTLSTNYSVYDLIGNVREWEDQCVMGPLGDCSTSGGSYYSDTRALGYGCGLGGPYVRNSVADDIGFRCCSL